MISLPKPRGFWDYGLFAFALAGFLLLLFWTEASGGIGWADAMFAFIAAVSCALAIVLVRRGEKARWIAHPTTYATILLFLGVLGWLLAAVYGDAYLLHRRDVNSVRKDIVPMGVGVIVVMLWARRRHSANR